MTDHLAANRTLRSALALQDLGERPRYVVAVPVRNEEDRIVACLQALARQVDGVGHRLPARQYAVVLLCNGCTDGSWQRIVATLPSLPTAIWAVEAELGAGLDHAGGARAAALGLAADLASRAPHGVVLTTDADTVVPADWIWRAASVLDAGRDAVAGVAEVRAEDFAALSPDFLARHQLETRYTALLDELDARADPVAHDPWPSHRACHGANLAIRCEALRALGPLPMPACGEDRAIIAALKRRDLRVRHDPDWRVTTSGRLHGRAAGGMADTLRQRHDAIDAPCDEGLESAVAAHFRATTRARLRRMHACGLMPDARELGRWLDMPPATVDPAIVRSSFGELWHWLEAHVPRLHRHVLSPSALPREITRAKRLLASLGAAGTEMAA
jgi:cellulose synthase/poly-beta-1,6-N-acetylglucosamine synthase-like glycosyltransferase